QTKFIISELNQMKVIFRVDEVHRIQRISWEQIDEPASLSMGLEETTSNSKMICPSNFTIPDVVSSSPID
ncbi:chemotaxis protein CheW, partial [Bacillus sp. D-CC]